MKLDERREAVRPVPRCGHVNDADGMCVHPDNLTPECTAEACPLVPPATPRRVIMSTVCGMPESMAREIVEERQRRLDVPDETKRAVARLILEAEGYRFGGAE